MNKNLNEIGSLPWFIQQRFQFAQTGWLNDSNIVYKKHSL
jgi:hypothetical protein